MRIPKLNVRPQSREFIQEFGGLDRRPRISENCFAEMKNLTSDFYPALAPRPKRGIVGNIENCNALLAGEKLAWVSGNTLYWGGEAVLELTAGESVPRQLVMMGAFIVVFPDNLYYNTVDPEDKGEFRIQMDSAEDEFTFSVYEKGDKTKLPQSADFELFGENGANDQPVTISFEYDGEDGISPLSVYASPREIVIPYSANMESDETWTISGVPFGESHPVARSYEVECEFLGNKVGIGSQDGYLTLTISPDEIKYLTGTVTVKNKQTKVCVTHNIRAEESKEWSNVASADDARGGYQLRYDKGDSVLYRDGVEVSTVLCVRSLWFSKVQFPEGYETEIDLTVAKGEEWFVPYLAGVSTGRVQVCFANGCMWMPGILHGTPRATTSSTSSDVQRNYTALMDVGALAPTMNYVIESKNRLWGCRYGRNYNGELVNEIYASALGDFRQWYTFAGVSTDSYVASVGHPGAFTGAINYRGHPLFFKENVMYKVYGDYPENYQIVSDTGMGVQQGCDKSLFVLSNMLYYKAPDGVFAYDGSSCQRIDAVLGNEHYTDAVCGGVGCKLWVSMKSEKDDHSGLYVCDTEKGLWHYEDAVAARFMTRYANDLYVLDADGRLFTVKGSVGSAEDGEISFLAESGVIGYSTPDSKYVSRLALRVLIPPDGSLQIFVDYDSANVWEFQGSIEGVGMQTFPIPVVPRRCDHFRIRLQGKGNCRIFGFSKVLEEGGTV